MGYRERSRTDGRRTHEGATARAGAGGANRAAGAGHGSARSRAARARALLRLHRSSQGRRSRPLRTCHARARRLPSELHRRRFLAGNRAPAAQAGTLRALCRPPGGPSHRRGDRRPEALQGRANRCGRAGRSPRHRAEARGHPVRADRAGQPDRRGKQMSREIIEFVQELERDKGIESDTLIEALEDALLAAYKKTPGASRHAVVELDREEGDFRVFSIDLPPDIEERLLEEARERVLTELEQAEEESGERSHVLVQDEDLEIDWSDVPEEQVKRADVTPENFGRIAAQTSKQVITQRIREAERKMMYEEDIDRVSQVATGIVPQVGDREHNLGQLGSRVRMVVSELRGEKIDIIPWNPEPARFVAKALSPARVREVYRDDDGKEATVVTPDDQLALAIGKEGMNARLAARLTGWKIDITSDSEFAQQEADAAFGGGEPGDENDVSGRCAAVLSNGKRCPNAALPGSQYCGVPAHQELALHETDAEDNPIVAESDPELEQLADTAAPEPVTEDAAAFGDSASEEFPA